MSSFAQPWPRVGAPAVHAGANVTLNLLAALVASAGLAAYLLEVPWLVWAGFVPALWLAFRSPVRLVALLAVMTPIFPVLRVADDTLGSREVSSRGLFLAADDPVLAALVVAWLWRCLELRIHSRTAFPQALLGLLAVYPAVIVANGLRLEWQQVLVSFLYYLKWAEYALLLYLIPGLVSRARAADLFQRFRAAFQFAGLLSAAFAIYEVTESIRTHTYSQAALFPRASSFFGTLDPARYGASEDPVNFGCYLIVTGSICLALSGGGKRRSSWGAIAAAVSFLGVVLSVSRAPMLGALFAYLRLQKLRAGRTLISVAGLAAAMGLAAIAFPDTAGTVLDRFLMIVPSADLIEGSAADRLKIVSNSPVFEIDSYWLTGHGHSSYRFVAEQHLAAFMGRYSRSLYNFPMTVWYDAGLAGLVLWGALLFQLNRYFRRIAERASDASVRALAGGLRAALWGLFVAAMFSEVPYNWRVMGVFYNAAGVCLAMAGTSLRQPVDAPRRDS